MSVLLEFQSSRRIVMLSADILSRTEVEIKKFDAQASVLISSDAGADDNVLGKLQYIVRWWSIDWNCFFDVAAAEDIKGGDRFAVVPKPNIDEVANEDNSTPKFVKFCIDLCCRTYAASLL